MIIFINFAPIEFMGGAEKWLLDIASFTSNKEETMIIDVTPSIANLYGRMVLKRKFSSYIDKNSQKHSTKQLKRVTLSWKHFIPFTKEYKGVKQYINNARLIYIKCELLEMIISFFFGGLPALKRIIGGIQSPLIYNEPLTIFDRFHNILYTSVFFKLYLQNIRKVHVLNFRDRIYLQETFKLSNVIELTDGIHIKKQQAKNKKPTDQLHIIYVGVLSKRKGIDTLVDIITQAPNTFVFHIIGDGPLRSEIESVSDNLKCIYHGYVDDETLHEIYDISDVIVFPSRSEALGLVMLEAMSHGLQTVVSQSVALNLPKEIEHVAKERNAHEYITLLEKLYKQKRNKKINNLSIGTFAYDHFSTDIIYPKFISEIIEL
jgi:glycosyltransferase involved in cell wall biosynthesis